MKFKRILSLVSAAALAAALYTPARAAAAFPDTVGHEYEEAINLFSSLGIINGMDDGTFAPDRTINRAEMCTILDRIFSYKQTAQNVFHDMSEDQWFAGSMLRAHAANVIFGDERGIRPMDVIRWDEALVMIGRAFKLPEKPETELPWPVADWARGYVGTIWEAGYLPEKELDMTGPFTRADAVAVLNNVIGDLGWEVAGKIQILRKLVPISEDVPFRTWDKTAFYVENGRTYYDDGVTPVSYGVDVSRHQEEIDWQAVAGDGIEFAMLRVGGRYWGSGLLYEDTRFEENLAGAQAAGLDVGVYFFSQAITPEEAVEEARFVLDRLAGRPLTYPVVFDWENISTDSGARTTGLDTQTLNACAVAFCETVAAAGYSPMVYFNGYLGLLRYDLAGITDYPFWYAGYNETPGICYDFRMWQYSSSGRVAGIEGDVDMDLCFRPYGTSEQVP